MSFLIIEMVLGIAACCSVASAHAECVIDKVCALALMGFSMQRIIMIDKYLCDVG